MAAEIAENKKKTAYAQFGTALLKYVLGPVIVALGIGSYANTNHQQSAAGYEVLAKAMNQQVMAKLEALETRVVKLEARVALQPASAPSSQPAAKLPKAGAVKPAIAKAPSKAPIPAKALIDLKAKSPSPAKVLMRVPEKLDLKPAPASMPAVSKEPKRPPAMKRVPEYLQQIKR